MIIAKCKKQAIKQICSHPNIGKKAVIVAKIY